MSKKPSEPRLAISNRCERLRFRDREVTDFFHALTATGLCSLKGELSVVFLSDAEMAELHGRFLNDPSPTDVITFPSQAEDDFAGEICVSAETAWRESRRRGIPLSREMCLYLAHGWLHLAGYDDVAEDDRLAMREAEKEVLEAAEGAAALPEFTFS